jgi:type VI secretion system protein ImpH
MPDGAPARPGAARSASPLEALTRAPETFKFDAAARILLAAAGKRLADGEQDDDRLRYGATPGLAQPSVEVSSAQAPSPNDPARLVTPLIGLIGPSGVMPRWYTELVAQSVRARSRAIADFFDLLAQRMVAAFTRAGIKYRLHRAAEDAAQAGAEEKIGAGLLALTGFGTAHLADRLAAGPEALKHYSGFFAARPRSADRLASMVADYLGRPVEIVEFAGAWLTVPPDQQSRMPHGRVAGSFNALGVDCAIGTRAWDQQARFIVRVGPLNRAEFEALLPDKPGLAALVSLIRAYVGWEADFAVNLLLGVSEIPPLQMAGGNVLGAPRLGWTSWTPSGTAGMRGRRFADEAVFGATLVESLS